MILKFKNIDKFNRRGGYNRNDFESDCESNFTEKLVEEKKNKKKNELEQEMKYFKYNYAMRNRVFSPYMEGVYSFQDIMKAVIRMRIEKDKPKAASDEKDDDKKGEKDENIEIDHKNKAIFLKKSRNTFFNQIPKSSKSVLQNQIQRNLNFSSQYKNRYQNQNMTCSEKFVQMQSKS